MKSYNTIIIGGGIVGAGIFRDLALHDIDVLLIDKYDFSSMTSERSSKMLHGGIRYLENLDFPLVYEALHEKNLWITIAPHLCFADSFYLPVFKNSKRPLSLIKIGLFLYDLLSGFKNTPHRIESKTSTLKALPLLNQNDLYGAGVYYDAIVDDSKLNLEVIYDALKSKKSSAKNYTELVDAKKINNYYKLKIQNTLTAAMEEVQCQHLIFATGPFTDSLLNKLNLFPWTDVLLPSKGSHIYLSKKRLNISHPVVITTKDDRIVFVIPHQEKILVGTTEIPTDENFFNVTPSKKEIEYLLAELNNYFPNQNYNLNDILYSFSGIRPLVKEDGFNLKKTSREHKVYQPESNVYIIAGGKYTTFRTMGQEITKEICHKNNRGYNPDLSQTPLSKHSTINSFSWKIPTKNEVEKICLEEMPRTFDDFFKRRLSISSRKIWELKTTISFEDFYEQNKDILKKYLLINEKDIINY